MKTKLILLAAIALLLAVPSFAQVAPNCVTQSLANYIKLGGGGCMFNNALYRNFTYSSPTPGGVTAAQILVKPVPPQTVPPLPVGLNFLAQVPWVAAAGTTQQSTIGYNIVPFPPTGPAPTNILTLNLEGAKVNGLIGTVDIKQNTTSGMLVFPPLEVFGRCVDVCTSKTHDQLAVTGFPILTVSLNITLTGGTNGVSLTGFATNDGLCPMCV